MRVLAVTVSDRSFFPGTLAAVNSLLHYSLNWPADWALDIAVISSGEFNTALTAPQIAALAKPPITVYQHTNFSGTDRVLGAWQLKAYAANDLSKAKEYDILIGFDSDLVFASDISDVIAKCVSDGKFRGGEDGFGVIYSEEYAPYGISAGTSAPYMSTSCYFCPLTTTNKEILADWAEKTNHAKYGPQAVKKYAGHGDQGVLNAVIAAKTRATNVEVLPNPLWSQHWRYETDVVEWDGAHLINYTADKQPMRALHCGGTAKFWLAPHAAKRLNGGQSQRWSYAHFLRFFHFGALSTWTSDPLQLIPSENLHLFSDVLNYHQLIFALDQGVRAQWAKVSPYWLERVIASEQVRRAMSLHGDGTGSMNVYVDLARQIPRGGTLVEIGSFYGGSAVTVAAATRHNDIRVISVESFTGNLNNTVDGWPLPSVTEYLKNVKHAWPYLNIDTIALPGQLAANLFEDNSLSMAFIDGDHSTPAVLRDIDIWWPKVAAGGVLAGDDYTWNSVRAAVDQKFPSAQNKHSVWWVKKNG